MEMPVGDADAAPAREERKAAAEEQQERKGAAGGPPPPRPEGQPVGVEGAAAAFPRRAPGTAPSARAGAVARLGSAGRRGAAPKEPPPRKKKGPAAPGPRPHPRRNPRPVTVDSSKARTSLQPLKRSLKLLRWKEFPFGRRIPCDIYWHGVSFHDNAIYSGQVNKFPGMTETVRKIPLTLAMRMMQELFPAEYDFYPRSWILPEEFPIFLAEVQMMKETNPRWKPIFIVKPDGGCQGDGIYLIKEPSDIQVTGSTPLRPAVVQEYMSKPFLIDNLKFDIRLYVLLKSLDPLEIYIAKNGLCRFCTEPYQEPTHKNLHQVFMHLTNYSLNVHSGNFVHSDSANTGSKQTFSSILNRLSSNGVNIEELTDEIISLVIKTVIAMVPNLKVYYQSDIPAGKPGPSCFQILGFDILLMKNLKPILMEVNANPSMRTEHEKEVSPGVIEYIRSPVDEAVKVSVIRDTLRLVDPRKKRKEKTLAEASEAEWERENDLLEEGSVENPELGDSKTSEAKFPSICLREVYPKYATEFDYLRLVDRIAALFIRFLGVKGTTKLGPTGFRMFIRNSKISNSDFSMASADILYIDITKKRYGITADQRDAGMDLHAFVEAICFLAQRRYKSLSLHEQVELLIDFAECNLAAQDKKRASCDQRVALVTCHQNRLHLRPATDMLVNYRSSRP
ncbi:tubulin polyglutamylase TTLL11 [Podarcis raffonei]|uniref:tubulin polyglutamylase TTLL11 n=1 Tax=Podarcis raffonei TaxID=65483 RepID=UPI0023297C6A|nr:tubulin polyglutamylase TTLL11 [Podarcis raffonei]